MKFSFRMFKQLFFFFPFLFFPFAVMAQAKGFSALKNTAELRASIAKSNKEKQSITSDFTQVKSLSLLSEKIKSKGSFSFKKEDKLRLEYTSPYKYLVVMNGGQLFVKDDQKSSHINTSSSKTFQSVNRIIIDCMSGSVFNQTDFTITAFESGSQYLLSLQPVDKTLQKLYAQIDLYLRKTSLDVDKIVLKENGGDFTEMEFTNTRHNVALNDALFRVK